MMTSTWSPPSGSQSGTSLAEITRSRPAVGMLVVTAGMLALGHLLAGLAAAVLTEANVPASRDLTTAGYWVLFGAALIGFGAVCVVAWQLFLARRWPGQVEISGAVVASLLIVIGALIEAVKAPDGSDSGSVVSAVGVGGWMLLALANAARCSMLEQAMPIRRKSDLWLLATAALLCLAVATGLPSPSIGDRALAIAARIVFLAGLLLLAVSLILSRRRGFIGGRGLTTTVAAVVTAAVASAIGAVASGFVFSPSPTLTAVRVGLSLPEFAEVVAWLLFSVAAFQRLTQLSLSAGAFSHTGYGWYGPAQYAAPPGNGPWGQPPAGWAPQPSSGWAYQQPPPGWGPQPATSPVPPSTPGPQSAWTGQPQPWTAPPRPIPDPQQPWRQAQPDPGWQAGWAPPPSDPSPQSSSLAPEVTDPPPPDPSRPEPTAPQAVHCGVPLPPDAQTCPHCGQPVTSFPS